MAMQECSQHHLEQFQQVHLNGDVCAVASSFAGEVLGAVVAPVDTSVARWGAEVVDDAEQEEHAEEAVLRIGARC